MKALTTLITARSRNIVRRAILHRCYFLHKSLVGPYVCGFVPTEPANAFDLYLSLNELWKSTREEFWHKS